MSSPRFRRLMLLLFACGALQGAASSPTSTRPSEDFAKRFAERALVLKLETEVPVDVDEDAVMRLSEARIWTTRARPLNDDQVRWLRELGGVPDDAPVKKHSWAVTIGFMDRIPQVFLQLAPDATWASLSIGTRERKPHEVIGVLSQDETNERTLALLQHLGGPAAEFARGLDGKPTFAPITVRSGDTVMARGAVLFRALDGIVVGQHGMGLQARFASEGALEQLEWNWLDACPVGTVALLAPPEIKEVLLRPERPVVTFIRAPSERILGLKVTRITLFYPGVNRQVPQEIYEPWIRLECSVKFEQAGLLDVVYLMPAAREWPIEWPVSQVQEGSAQPAEPPAASLSERSDTSLVLPSRDKPTPSTTPPVGLDADGNIISER